MRFAVVDTLGRQTLRPLGNSDMQNGSKACWLLCLSAKKKIVFFGSKIIRHLASDKNKINKRGGGAGLAQQQATVSKSTLTSNV